MVEKILQGYMEKLHNLIRDEIRDFVQYSLEFQEGTENEFYIFLSINTNQPKKYQIRVDGENIKFTDVSIGKAKVIDEERLIKDLETVAENYIKLCNKAEIPTINPSTKKLLEIAKNIRNEIPEEIRWRTETIISPNGFVTLKFPKSKQEIQVNIYTGECILWFIGNLVFLEAVYRIEKDEIHLHGKVEENKKKFTKFLKKICQFN